VGTRKEKTWNDLMWTRACVPSVTWTQALPNKHFIVPNSVLYSLEVTMTVSITVVHAALETACPDKVVGRNTDLTNSLLTMIWHTSDIDFHEVKIRQCNFFSPPMRTRAKFVTSCSQRLSEPVSTISCRRESDRWYEALGSTCQRTVIIQRA